MSRLVELIKELCPNGVDYKKIDEILKTVSAPRKLMRKEYQSIGKFPIVDQGQEFIVGYTDDIDAILEEKEYIILGEHTRIIKYVNFEFAQGADGLKILISKHKDDVKYLYHAFSNLEIPSRGYNRHWTIAKELKIPLPPIEVQREIVRILDNFTELTAELTAELKKRKSQYEFYRDKLLDFGDKVEYMCLSEVSSLTAGGDVPKSRFSYFQTEEFRIPIYSNGIGENALYGFTDIPKICETSVTISARGTIGYSALRNEAFYPIVRLICATPDKRVIVEFLKYFLETVTYSIPASGIPQLTIPMVSKVRIPIPPLSEQERIVSILDKFDALVNDISIGLPAEIEARKKQYEYYREKLLNFKDVNASEIL